MATRRERVTVIAVPQSGKRSLSFQLTPAVIRLAGALVFLTITALAGLIYLNGTLRTQVAALHQLKEINQQQQVEIQSMTWKSLRTEERLDLLGRFQEQLRKYTRQTPSPVPVPDGADPPASAEEGRGGRQPEEVAEGNVPVLSTFLPREMKPYIFIRCGHLVVHEGATFQGHSNMPERNSPQQSNADPATEHASR